MDDQLQDIVDEAAARYLADRLLPRRKEIWQVIKDHPQCSFDFISRRFIGVNPKTLHYDLGQLIKQGLVKKLGVTRGAVYESVIIS